LNVISEPVEKLVVARVFQRLLRSREIGSGLRQADDLQTRIEKQHKIVERLRGERAVLDTAQQDREQRADTKVYLANRQTLNVELAEETAKLASLQQQLDVPYPVGDDWNNLPGWFEHGLNLGQQSKLVLAYIKKVVVLPPGRSGRYFKPERVVVIPTDSQQADSERD
jgi:phosphoglycerate-specific signal transduction histidine kinase